MTCSAPVGSGSSSADGCTSAGASATAPRVLLVGHLDTVWPVGTLVRWPFELRDGRATGPGVFDMKAGVVQLLFALAASTSTDGVAVLLTTDEETGSPTGPAADRGNGVRDRGRARTRAERRTAR